MNYEDEENEEYSLVGVDGNAYVVMGYVVNCMRKEHKTKEEIEAYRKDAMSSDYDHLIAVSNDMICSLNEERNENG